MVRIFCDIETTGLNAYEHEIISISMLVDSIHGSSEWTALIKPKNIDTADPVALKINGYNEETWAQAITLEEALVTIAKKLDVSNGIFIGWNPQFDLSFIRMALLQGGYKVPRLRVIDAMVLAHEHLIGLQSLKLVSVREYLGLDNSLAHTALQDAKDTRKIYWMLYRASLVDRLYYYAKYKLLSYVKRIY